MVVKYTKYRSRKSKLNHEKREKENIKGKKKIEDIRKYKDYSFNLEVYIYY